jgi:transposase
MQPLFTELLSLPGIDVEDYHLFDDKIIFEVEAHSEKAVCPRCQTESTHLHQNHGHFVRDLNLIGREVLLKVNRRQFKCAPGGKPFSEELDFVGKQRKHTDRFAAMIVQQVIHSDLHNVGQQNGLTDEEVWSIIQYISKKNLVIDLTQLKRLGIDEIALRKGQDDYITVLIDLDRRVPIGFVCSRKHKDIKEVLKGWGSEVLNQIIEVSIDMSGNYRGLVQKLMPDANIIADRFHVMKLVGAELNSAIIQAKKATESMTDAAEKMRMQEALKHSKYALLKPEESLTEKQQLKLAEVQQVSPLLAEMHRQKEAFRNIFETAKDWSEGTFRLLDWLAEAETNFEQSVGTIKRWLSEITGYFDHRTTSGAVEGINHRLKLIKRLGYGFRNFGNFALRCLICWHLDISSA